MQEHGFADALFLGLAHGLMSLGESVVSDVAGSIRKVNPTGGTMNCVNCAIATDATLAGAPGIGTAGWPNLDWSVGAAGRWTVRQDGEQTIDRPSNAGRRSWRSRHCLWGAGRRNRPRL